MFLSYSTSVLINIDIKISIKINIIFIDININIDNITTCYSISKYSISYHLMFNHQELFQPFSETMLLKLILYQSLPSVSVRVTVQQGSSNCRSNDNDSTILMFLQFKCAARQNSRAVHTTTLRIIFGNDLSKGHVHTYTGFSFFHFKKNISIHMKTQKHAMKHCQEHAKPTGGDIISTVKPCWPIRSLKKFPVGGDNSACSDVTSQIFSSLFHTSVFLASGQPLAG